jgi:hypothetical protein
MCEILVTLCTDRGAGTAHLDKATGHGLDGRGVRVLVGQEFSLLHVVLSGSGADPASYPMGTGDSFPRG